MNIIQPEFIQKDKGKPNEYDFCYIYKFFVYSSRYDSFFKYIIRAEAFQDCFAIKFYCSRFKHSENKYSKILNAFNAKETLKIFYGIASVIPVLLRLHPGCSFCFMGASTFDPKGKREGRENNQRYRIYSEIAKNVLGNETLEIILDRSISSGLFINKKSNPDTQIAEKRIVDYFHNIYDFEI